MVAIITGASSGIGLATARYLSQKGYKIYGISRTLVQNEPFESIVCDITNYDAFQQAVDYVLSKEGKIDALINNAGMGISGAIEYSPTDDIRKIFDVNILAMINACKCVAKPMRMQKSGRIINIGSVAGQIPIPFQTCYSATKSAVQMFSLAFGLEVKNFGIYVSCVMPGDTKTGFTASRVKSETDEGYDDRITKSVAKMERDERAGKSPESVSGVIYRLLTSKNPPPCKTVGFTYKLIILLEKLLPTRLMLWVVKKLYG